MYDINIVFLFVHKKIRHFNFILIKIEITRKKNRLHLWLYYIFFIFIPIKKNQNISIKVFRKEAIKVNTFMILIKYINYMPLFFFKKKSQ